jgi:hypothetical protein
MLFDLFFLLILDNRNLAIKFENQQTDANAQHCLPVTWLHPFDFSLDKVPVADNTFILVFDQVLDIVLALEDQVELLFLFFELVNNLVKTVDLLAVFGCI